MDLKPLPKKYRTGLVHDSVMAGREKHALVIGSICATWAGAEQMLAVAFALILGTERLLAMEIMENVLLTQQKANILRAVAKNKIHDVEIRKAILEAVERIKAASGDRNAIVHGRWAMHPDLPDHLVLLQKTGKRMFDEARLVSVSDLGKLNREIHSATEALWMLTADPEDLAEDS